MQTRAELPFKSSQILTYHHM